MIKFLAYNNKYKQYVLKVFRAYPAMFGHADLKLLNNDLANNSTHKQRKYVAIEGRKVLGFGEIITPPDSKYTWKLRWLAVAPDVKGKGLGTKFIKFLESKIAQAEHKTIYLDTLNSSDPVSVSTRAFYEKRGYQKVGLLPKYYGKYGDKIIYGKTLE